MAYSNPADLNSHAAVDFDELRFHDEDPGGDYTASVHAGPYAISMGTPGAAGPSSSLQPAADGRAYASQVTAVLSVACGWASVRDSSSGAVRIWRLGRGPIGPGSFPVVYAFAARNAA